VFHLQILVQIVLPQLAGLAVLYRASLHRSRARFALAPFVVAGIYFVWSWLFWSAEADRVYAVRGQHACGAFGALVVFAIFGGALAHFALSGAFALIGYLSESSRRKIASERGRDL